MVPTLRLYFLGALDILWDDQSLPKPPTLKSQSLLAYLILHRHQPQPRDRLVGIFWGDRPERKARSSLSTSLWHIRRCLPDEALILSDPHSVQFDPRANLWLDVEAFESSATCGVCRYGLPALFDLLQIPHRGRIPDFHPQARYSQRGMFPVLPFHPVWMWARSRDREQ